jgi:chemotaxis protein CheD
MNRVDDGIPARYLRPGDICCCNRPTRVSTVLGSCVSITMYNRRLRVGGMSHGILPVCGKPGCAGLCAESYRFVACSIYRLHYWFTEQGVTSSEIEVKLFGGADLIATSGRFGAGVGEQNIAAAFRAVSDLTLRISVSDVGGTEGRKIIFDTCTGEVLLKRIRKVASPGSEGYDRQR